MLFLHHLVTKVINYRMGTGVGPIQTMGCLNIQTMAVTTGAMAFTLRVVTCNNSLSLACSEILLNPLNQAMYFITARLSTLSLLDRLKLKIETTQKLNLQNYIEKYNKYILSTCHMSVAGRVY